MQQSITSHACRNLVQELAATGHLAPEGYRALLLDSDPRQAEVLHAQARRVAQQRFGKGIFVRGLIEFTNQCRGDCLYCGIRRSNTHVRRYRLTSEQVLECCRVGYELGFRTFVLQGGEWDDSHDDEIAALVTSIRHRYPHVAITLSLGEKSREAYALFKKCGADRYLLRHETHNAEHYGKLHPPRQTLAHRLQCLEWLKELGYQVGTGMMVGSPYQRIDDLLGDIEFIEQFKPHMIGLGPFIPQHDTPLGTFPPGSVATTARLYSIFRLMHPGALIPSTTAMATLAPGGRIQGILAGANVVMPNLSPTGNRRDYALYDHKAYAAAESAEGLRLLDAELSTIGYHIDYSRGDYHASAR